MNEKVNPYKMIGIPRDDELMSDMATVSALFQRYHSKKRLSDGRVIRIALRIIASLSAEQVELLKVLPLEALK